MAEAAGALHFARPDWLWALLFPVPVALWLFFTRSVTDSARMRRYADPELLPYLLRTHAVDVRMQWIRFARWSVLWLFGVLAMAGPRWDFTDVTLFEPGSNLVVLFDISRSMNVDDVSPSRLGRARQELEDLLSENRGTRVGLIAFASVSHVVSPLTEDTENMRRLLPALVPGLVRLQGSRLSPALDRANELLAAQPSESGKSILLITDGDFREEGLEERLRRLSANGVRLHILGMGTPDGGRVPGPGEGWLKADDGSEVISRLNEPLLQSLAKAGNGTYQRADYLDQDTRSILSEVEEFTSPHAAGEGRTRIWHERFYWLIGLSLLLILPWFRRHAAMPGVKR